MPAATAKFDVLPEHDDTETVGTRGVYATYRLATDKGLCYVTRTGRWAVRKDSADPKAPWTLYRVTKAGKATASGAFRTSDLALLWARGKDVKSKDIALSYGTGKTFGVPDKA